MVFGIIFMFLFNNKKMEDILAYKLNLKPLDGVKVNLSEIFDKKYTCDGENMNPAIIFPKKGVYAVIVEDPDAPAGTWFHWGIIVWDTDRINENISKTFEGPNFYQTYNDFYYHDYIVGSIKGIGYDGPCPPKGHGYHRYFFEIFELKKKPDKGIKDKNELYNFIRENAISVYIFISKYKR